MVVKRKLARQAVLLPREQAVPAADSELKFRNTHGSVRPTG